MLLSKMVNEDQSFRFHWRCERTRLTHLMFVDDLLQFCGDSASSAQVLHKALEDFFKLLGFCFCWVSKGYIKERIYKYKDHDIRSK